MPFFYAGFNDIFYNKAIGIQNFNNGLLQGFALVQHHFLVQHPVKFAVGEKFGDISYQ